MPYLAIEDFKGGLDKRRMSLTSPPGSLQQAQNVHITRGAELEKAKKLVPKYTLPEGTFGFADVNGLLYVFGSTADPGVPVGMQYQRLQHPGSVAMSNIISVTKYSGKLYVVAEFIDGSQHHFYDTTRVTDWSDGLVDAEAENNNDIAENLRILINASPDYIATRSGAEITITGEENTAFTITASAVNGGSVDDQAISLNTPQSAIEDVTEVRATASFRISGGSNDPVVNKISSITVDGVDILGAPSEALAEGSFDVTGGTSSPGVNKFDSVTVNGVDVLGATVNHTGTNSTTAQAIVDQINTYTSSPNYTATRDGDTVEIHPLTGTGTGPNGYAVVVNSSGDATSGSVANMAGGVDSGIAWATSNSATATAVAAQITSNTSSPNYTATADGSLVTITAAATTGATPNGHVLNVTEGGDVVITDEADMAGGVTAVAGQPQISKATISGTFEEGDLFTITLGGQSFGADQVTGQPVTKVLTYKKKIHAVSAKNLIFSAVNDPLGWKEEDVGSGLIDMSAEQADTSSLTGLAVYQSNLAIFSRRNIQIWFIEVDPGGNQPLQLIENIGSVATDAVITFGDNDVIFLSDSGIRSLRTRDSSGDASLNDIGTPIDTIVVELMKQLNDTQIQAAQGIVEPRDGRPMITLDGTTFVFSYFRSAKISAWSRYDYDFAVDKWVVIDNRVYARAGATIYLLGGDDDDQYMESAIVELPYFNAGTIATWKSWTGLDMALEGEWDVYGNTDPNQPDEWHLLCIVNEHTINELSNAIQEFGPVFKLKFENSDDQYARIGKVIAHYSVDDEG